MLISRKIRDFVLDILSLPNTILFNFKYLPFKQAVKLPVYVSYRVWLMQMDGRIQIQAPIHRRMISIGFGRIGIFDRHKSRTIWQVAGTVIFKGRAKIGHGSKISVGGRAELVLGDGFTISAESTIVANKKVEIGNNVLFSWDILLVDTDFHAIKDNEGVIINPDVPVIIGDKVWIGCRSMILKGSEIPSGTIIAAGTTITSSLSSGTHSIVGGNPVRVLKEGVYW